MGHTVKEWVYYPSAVRMGHAVKEWVYPSADRMGHTVKEWVYPSADRLGHAVNCQPIKLRAREGRYTTMRVTFQEPLL